MEKIKVAVIGGGSRGRYVVSNLLRDSQNQVEPVALFDPDEKVAQATVDFWRTPETRVVKSAAEAIAAPGVSWVMVFSPNAFHCEHILAGFAAGKHVFSEKPMVTTLEDCIRVYEAHRAHPELKFATGFVLRYAPLYRRAKEILASGEIGRILSIDANENIAPAHGGYMAANWRSLKKFSGPHILEKCCHDLDLMNWFCDSLPTKIGAFGDLDFFRPENEYLREKYGDAMFHSWDDPHRTTSAFLSEKDIIDNQVAILRYRNGIKAQFQATMSNSIPERRMFFSCTEGTMILELYAGTLVYRRMGSEGVTTVNFAGDGHGGGDDHIMKELFQAMTTDMLPRCSGREGIDSAVTALTIDQAMREERIVDLEPLWRQLDR